MELQTISQVSKHFAISTRTLRYYEEIGLIQPTKKEDFSYRTYDTDAIARLRQIVVLRKLRIPLKQIAEILISANARVAIEAFECSLTELEDEITALSTIRNVIKTFIEQLNLGGATFTLPDDASLLEVVDSLTVSKINFKEDKTMDDVNKANENLMRMEDRDVRIVYLPPMTVAAAFAEGENTEGITGEMIQKFVNDTKLLDIKPDARSFGFDCSPEFQGVGVPSKMYEAWVSIPDDMDVPPPLVKRKFNGGLYAAHVLRAWDFEDWRRLKEWVNASEKFHNDWDSPRWISSETKAGQGFEETINFYNFAKNPIMQNMQLDLLFPIREVRIVQDCGADYITYSSDTDSINRNYKRQYDEINYALPANLSLADYSTVTVNGKSPEGKTAVKFYDANGDEAFVVYNNQSEDYTDWNYELSGENKGKTIQAIGIMSQDAKSYSAAIRSITFKK